MDIKQPHSTRFLPVALIASLALALGGCAGTPEEEVEETPEVVETPAPEPAAPAPVELKPNYPEKYVVVRGDTLWDISSRFLKNPWVWPQLWHYNPHIDNPHLIYPGDELSIVFINGKPVMQISRNGKPVGMAPSKTYPTVRLSPGIREEGLDAAVPTIPLDVIGPFLSRPRVVGEGELEKAPYIMAHADNHLASGGGYQVYVRGLKQETVQGDYSVVREGQVYRRPESSEVLGYEAVHIGDARLTRFGDPSTMLLTSSKREVLRGDRLMPKGDDVLQHRFLPHAPAHQVNGQIIAVLEGVKRIGQYQIVVLDLGRQDDIEPGHVLAVNQTGAQVEDIVASEQVKLPDERAGTVMVFRVFDRVSYALVMEATKTLYLNDQVLNP